MPKTGALHAGESPLEVVHALGRPLPARWFRRLEGISVDAVAGDMVIVPPDAWHSFVNTGSSMLRQTAIHQNARAATEFEDGSRRD